MKTNFISRRRWLLSPALFVIALPGAVPAHAAAVTNIFSLQSIAASSPSTGNAFEVDLTNIGSNPIDVDAFTFGLSMTNANFTFTSAHIETLVNTYIFAGNSLFGDPISSSAGVDTLVASDVWGGAGNGFVVGTGVTVALGEVFVNVASGVAPGPYTVSFVSNDDSLSDINTNLFPVADSSTGTVTVSGSVPEPSSLILMLAGAGALAVWGRRARGAKRERGVGSPDRRGQAWRPAAQQPLVQSTD